MAMLESSPPSEWTRPIAIFRFFGETKALVVKRFDGDWRIKAGIG